MMRSERCVWGGGGITDGRAFKSTLVPNKKGTTVWFKAGSYMTSFAALRITCEGQGEAS